jgi:hypothetical protein
MPGICRIVALLLLIAMAAALPGPRAMAFPPMAGHPAGCHGHGPATPTRVPTSYQCCATGHQAALPNAAFSFCSPAAQFCRLNAGESFGSDVAPDLPAAALVAPSDSPPITTSLRI